MALNKIDLPEVAARWPEVEAGLRARGYDSLAVSALAGTNVRNLLYRAAQLLDQVPSIVEIAHLPVYRVASDPREFTVRRESKGWRISGEAIERAAAMTYWEYDQSVRRFQRILQTLGIEAALRQAGIQQGDTVFIGKYELEWED